jgi:hypothetical protein
LNRRSGAATAEEQIMTQAAESGSGGAGINFAEIRRQAVEQSRPVDVHLKSTGFELLPGTALDYVQAFADEAHGRGSISDDDHKYVTDSAKRMKVIFGPISQDRVQEHVEALRARNREELAKPLDGTR